MVDKVDSVAGIGSGGFSGGDAVGGWRIGGFFRHIVAVCAGSTGLEDGRLVWRSGSAAPFLVRLRADVFASLPDSGVLSAVLRQKQCVSDPLVRMAADTVVPAGRSAAGKSGNSGGKFDSVFGADPAAGGNGKF